MSSSASVEGLDLTGSYLTRSVATHGPGWS